MPAKKQYGIDEQIPQWFEYTIECIHCGWKQFKLALVNGYREQIGKGSDDDKRNRQYTDPPQRAPSLWDGQNYLVNKKQDEQKPKDPQKICDPIIR